MSSITIETKSQGTRFYIRHVKETYSFAFKTGIISCAKIHCIMNKSCDKDVLHDSQIKRNKLISADVIKRVWYFPFCES